MNLLERLNKQIQRLVEEDVFYLKASYKNEPTEIIKNPSNNTFQSLLKKEFPDGLRGLYYKNDWYFWDANGPLHSMVADEIGLKSRVLDIIAASVEVDKYNRLGNDYWDRIIELKREGLEGEELRQFLVKVLKTLKSLKNQYRTDLKDIKKIMPAMIKPFTNEDPMTRMTPTQRHQYRLNKRDQISSLVDDMFKYF